MALQPNTKNIAFLGDYVPRRCGIATFTADICEAVAAEFPETQCIVGSVNDRPEGYDYPPRVRFEIEEQELDSYRRAAEFLNINNVEVRLGAARVWHLRRRGGQPSARRSCAKCGCRWSRRCTPSCASRTRISARSWSSSIALSNRFIVMAERGRELLETVYGVAPEKIDLIPHGVIDMPFIDSNFYKDDLRRRGQDGAADLRAALAQQGHRVCHRGAAGHPRAASECRLSSCWARRIRNLLAHEGEAYRRKLERLAKERGVSDARHLSQSLRHARGAEGIHRRGGHLHHAVSQRGADHLRHAGLHVRRGQGGHLDALLACAGIARRGARHAGALSRLRRDRGGRESLSLQPDAA